MRREMNERSPTMMSTGPSDRVEIGVPDVASFEIDDSWVGTQPFVELTVADVERHDLSRTSLQQAVGEPAGRCADVERTQPATSTSKASRAWSSFSAPRPTNRAGGPSMTSASPGATWRAALSATEPLTSTRLAAINDCASVRLDVIERRTSSASSRRRAATMRPSIDRCVRGLGVFGEALVFRSSTVRLDRAVPTVAQRPARPEPSSPGPSWPQPSSSPEPSSPAAFFFAGAFLAAAFLAVPSWPACRCPGALARPTARRTPRIDPRVRRSDPTAIPSASQLLAAPIPRPARMSRGLVRAMIAPTSRCRDGGPRRRRPSDLTIDSACFLERSENSTPASRSRWRVVFAMSRC